MPNSRQERWIRQESKIHDEAKSPIAYHFSESPRPFDELNPGSHRRTHVIYKREFQTTFSDRGIPRHPRMLPRGSSTAQSPLPSTRPSKSQSTVVLPKASLPLCLAFPSVAILSCSFTSLAAIQSRSSKSLAPSHSQYLKNDTE